MDRNIFRNQVVAFTFVVVASAILIYFFCRKRGEALESFYESEISSLVISSRQYGGGKTVEFKLDDGNSLYFNFNQKIDVGDSVSKIKNSFTYRIYRKDANGNFQATGDYDALRIYD